MKGLSVLLACDLSQEGLFLAADERGMSQNQRDLFVASLITLDLSGKKYFASTLKTNSQGYGDAIAERVSVCEARLIET